MDLFNLNIICEEPEPKKIKKTITAIIPSSSSSLPRVNDNPNTNTITTNKEYNNNKRINRNKNIPSKRKEEDDKKSSSLLIQREENNDNSKSLTTTNNTNTTTTANNVLTEDNVDTSTTDDVIIDENNYTKNKLPSNDSSNNSSDVIEKDNNVVETSNSTKINDDNENLGIDGSNSIINNQDNAIISPKKESNRKLSRRHHNKDFLDDEENRAKYMSEFHARPLEIDRRSNVKNNSTIIIPSKKSNHLFDDKKDTNTTTTTVNSSNTDNPFRNIGIQDKIANALVSKSIFGLKQPTVIQKKVLSALFVDNPSVRGHNNIFIQSETGSGKTFAYLIPIIQSLVQNINSSKTNEKKTDIRSKIGTKCIILCPTRELTNQIFQTTEKLCRVTYNYIIPGILTGGEKRKSEKNRIRKGITIIISTPGRLLDHMNKTECLLSNVKQLDWFVLDEVDRLLDMGLGAQVKKIVDTLRIHLQSDDTTKVCSWNSILVSATIHKEVQKLGCDCFGHDDNNSWMNIFANKNENKKNKKVVEEQNDDDNKLFNSTPRQLMHFHMMVSAKLRLSALISFLVSRVNKKERTVIFMSTCDSVDFHYRLFLAMNSIMLDNKNNTDDDNNDGGGIFGKHCTIYRLHGNVPFQERNKILLNFCKSDTNTASILIATDVVARGLNIPKVDWILQYDPPCEMADYVHRAGRAARAGEGGHALVFLLPSETKYLEALQLRGLQSTTALSLTSTLYDATKLCNKDILPMYSSKKKVGGYATNNDNREAEAFVSSIQYKLEECVSQSRNNDKDSMNNKNKRKRNNPTENKQQSKKDDEIYLTDLASKAFTSFIRAYPTREKAVRHIFSARALHLGHIAKSFALKEGPRQIAKKFSASAGKKYKTKS